MKKIVLLAFVLVFLSTAVFVRFARPVEAGGTIYIRADGSVEGTTCISSVDNVTYTLTDNIVGNYIVVERDNIVVDGAGYTLWWNFHATAAAIELTGRSNVTIKNMEIVDFFWGIILSNSSSNSISGNFIYSTSASIRLKGSSNNNTISGNNIRGNWNGVAIYSSFNNTVSGNNLTNSFNGILLENSSDNKFYHNNLGSLGGRTVLTFGYANFWDNGYPSGGNYWNTYTGVDVKSGPNQDQLSGDGIGDTPYVVDANNTDHYPLMYPWGAPPPPSYTLTIYSSPTGMPFTVSDISRTTPWLGTYSEGASVSLEMLENHTVGDAKYNWNQWSDGVTTQSRTVTMNANIALTAHYTGPYYQLTVTSSPITEITFTINDTLKTTQYTELLLEGSYTLVMPKTYNGYVWSHWLEDGDTKRSKTITLQAGTTWTAVYIPTPFWMQWWFWTIVALVIVALTGAVYFLRKRKRARASAPTLDEFL